MLTTNHAYGVDFFRPDLVLRNHSLGDGYEGSSYSSNRDTPVPDIEGKTSGTHRKRVPVACERCRKRKIKCSGDQGDGTGCDNCKVAGHDGCQFLRVHSKPMQCPQAYSTPRWQAQHYHPYSRAHNTHPVHRAQQHPQYAPQQHALSYNTWQQNGLEYGGFPTPTSAAVSWNTNNYAPTYQMYEAEHTSPYSSHPPSYMLPDPAHGGRSEMSYLASLSRSPHSSVWLDSPNNALSHHHAQNGSPVYPLTPAESTKSYSILSQPGHISLSYERTLPTPSQAIMHQTLPSQGRETPPLSAVSHRSSHTWNTDSGSNVSAASSRTSCGGSQDLTAVAQALTTCEDQAVMYSYQTDEANPQLDSTISSLPVTCEEVDNQSACQQASQTTQAEEAELSQLQARTSRENLRTSSPHTYSYPTRLPSRRSHNMFPPRLMTSFSGGSLPVVWNVSPSTTSSRHNSQASQAVIHPQSAINEEYVDDHGQGSGSGSLDPIY